MLGKIEGGRRRGQQRMRWLDGITDAIHICLSKSLCTVILEPKKIDVVSVSTFPPSICHEVMGQDAMILVF